MPARYYLILSMLLGAATATFPISDPDAFFHLALGREIVEGRSIPVVETMTIVSEGRPYINHEWGYDCLLWLAYSAFGLPGLTLFKALLSALLFGASGLIAMRLHAPLPLFATFLTLFLPFFRLHLDARPHVLGYLCAAQAFLLLLRIKDQSLLALIAFPLLSALWANLHGSFPLLIPLCLVALLFPPRTTTSARWLVLAALAGLLSTLLNPFGPRLWLAVLHHAEPAYRKLIPEWMPLSFGEEPLVDIFFFAIYAITLLSFLRKENRSHLERLLYGLIFMVPGLLSTKFTLGLAISAIPLLASNLKGPYIRLTPLFRHLFSLLAAASFLTLQWFLPPYLPPGTGIDNRDRPDAALLFALEHHLEGKAFAPFHEGGYIEFVAYPKIRPFIDGRAYQHGLPSIAQYLRALEDYGSFKALHQRFRFDIVLADLTDPAFPRLLQGLTKDPDFLLLHLDSRYALFVPKSHSPPPVEPFKVLRPTTDPRYLADLPAPLVPLAEKEIERLLRGPKGRLLGLLLRGVLSLSRAGISPEPKPLRASLDKEEWCKKALVDFEELVSSREDVPMFRYFLAKALICLGRLNEASNHLTRISSLFPDAAKLLQALSGQAHGP